MQLALDVGVDIKPSDYAVGDRSSGQTHGVVLTKPHVVRMILDLVGYREPARLSCLRLLEPSCGEGAFLTEAVTRLVREAMKQGRAGRELRDCVVAFDIDPFHVSTCRDRVRKVLVDEGLQPGIASELVALWIREGDFLLARDLGEFDFIVGNPPYIRIEQLSARLLAEYRRRFESLFDRADLYVAFIERSLQLLGNSGVLSFICADRWISNRYGGPLRRLVTRAFRLESYIDLHTSSPFESEVIAYPSIFVVGRGLTKEVAVARMDCATESECLEIAEAVMSGMAHPQVERHEDWFADDEPWVLTPLGHLRVLRELESDFPPVSDEASVGIGVASGADKVFIVDEKSAEGIERDRLVPLVMRGDIENGRVRDGGRFIINVFGDDGACVDLEKYPGLARYLDRHADAILRRHVAKKNPKAWFRTIDRVYPDLVGKPKLLIPDIAGSNEIAFDPGAFHPHHNLYFVVSNTWDVEVLGGLLSSRVALFFVWSYAVKMRGSYLRFQAQYLRRIRVPRAESLSASLKAELKSAFRARDFGALDRLALKAYGLKSLPGFDFVDTRK